MEAENDGLILRVEQNGAGPVVHVAGEIDLATTGELSACLEALDGRVVVDLAGVSFLDSSGMGTLVRARNRLTRHGGDLRLRAVHDNVRTVLEVTGLGGFLDVEV